MLNIGDFSKLTHVSVRMLRYYDEHGLLKPDRTDKYTGYRMYSAKQLPDLQRIIMLRDLNFSIAEITEVLKNWSNDFLVDQLHNKIHEKEQTIAAEKRLIERIKATISATCKKQIEVHYNVTIKSIPSCNIISLRRKVPTYFSEGELWDELSQFVSREHIDIERHSYNNVAIYHDEEHMESDVDEEVAFIVKKIGINKDGFTFRELECVDNMACMMVYGPYDNLPGAYKDFIYWLDDHSQYEMKGLSRQITVIDKSDTTDPNSYLTEIQIPVQLKQIIE